MHALSPINLTPLSSPNEILSHYFWTSENKFYSGYIFIKCVPVFSIACISEKISNPICSICESKILDYDPEEKFIPDGLLCVYISPWGNTSDLQKKKLSKILKQNRNSHNRQVLFDFVEEPYKSYIEGYFS